LHTLNRAGLDLGLELVRVPEGHRVVVIPEALATFFPTTIPDTLETKENPQ